MITIIIDLPSSFVAYLVAYSIYLYYKNKLTTFQIIIVENNDYNDMMTDILPWCGTTITSTTAATPNNAGLIPYLVNGLITDQCLIPLNEIHIDRSLHNNNPIYDKSIQMEQIIVNIGLNNNLIGLLYHPTLIINKLRYLLFKTNRVIFMSNNSNLINNKSNLINKLLEQQQQQQPVIVILNNEGNNKYPTINKNINYLINSNLIGIKYRNFSRAIAHPPSTILWLPNLFNQLNLTTTNNNQLNYRIIRQESNGLIINIQEEDNNSIINHEIFGKVDINFVLKYCKTTLMAIDNLLINYGYMKSLSNKL
ncbi:uncharacterized protein J8A68_005577 [[Candida] subhashii]|uniref:Uncharacterized protein n=1 Tax=[Candida] subhashii TaxID=561895 RepID=A0A8J5UHL1_9ASCO|nr:uncharacterized protein J8A68_005577 [[Candida] subhashii]KAG7660902.1 hypothetical protein J8A68_005577 [[Candida] subhashii]